MANITRRKAEQVLRVIQAEYPDCEDMRLYAPGFHANGWTIASEEAPSGWTIRERPEVTGVFSEAVNHWALGLYPA